MSLVDFSAITLWNSAVSKIKQINPALGRMLSQGKIVSAENNTFTWQPVNESSSIFLPLINKDETKELIMNILSETSKNQCRFIAKELDAETAYVNELYEQFGKEPVEIRDDDTNKNTDIKGYDVETDEEFSMIGKSGCGKSTSLNDLLAHYPQVIIHYDEEGRPFVQILYIVVNVAKKSNFRALYENIGEAIDRALGNVKPVYKLELTCKNNDNLGVVNNKLRNIIERLCIGMIILDEFQNMSLDSSSENSMDSLLFLGNETKVVFGVVGTRFSKNFLNKPDDLKSRRRLGVEIPADSYCQSEKFVYEFIDWLFQFQMFIPYVTPTEEIKEALMDCSAGIIDQIVSIFSFMNTDFIMRPPEKRSPVNGNYVREIANKYFPSMQRLLKKMTLTQLEEEELRREKKEAEAVVNEATLKLMAAENRLEKISPESAKMNDRITVRDEAVSNLYLRLDKKYNKAHIEQYVVSAMESITKAGMELTVEAVEEAAKAEIEKTKSDTRRNTANVLLKQNRPATNDELNKALDM